MAFDEDLRKGLGEDVRRHVLGGKVVNLDVLLVGNLVANPEFLNWDMLHARVVHSIVEDLDGGLIVEVKRRWFVEGVSDFTEEVSHPLDFRTCKGCSIELGFR